MKPWVYYLLCECLVGPEFMQFVDIIFLEGWVVQEQSHLNQDPDVIQFGDNAMETAGRFLVCQSQKCSMVANRQSARRSCNISS